MRELIRQILKEHTFSLTEGKKSNTEDFIKKAREIHGDKYGYDKVDYVNNKTDVIITCPIHGDFLQTPDRHLRGYGCKKCGSIESAKKRVKPAENFIAQAKEIHGDKYDYSKVDYQANNKDVIITCPIHGDFPITPIHHLRGQGCKQCGVAKRGMEQRKSVDEFITQARKIHGNKYNYSKVDYQGTDTPVTIICPIHGEFPQTPYLHLKGQGCPICSESKGERMTAQALDSLGIKYERRYSFNDCVSTGCRKLYFDFYIPRLNTLIEYDGKQHFEPIPTREEDFEGSLERDEIKNNYAKKNGIRLLRIPYTINTKELIEKDIKRFLRSKKIINHPSIQNSRRGFRR